MAATPEDVAEPEPFSPSVFLDLPPTPHPQPDGDGEDLQASSDDMVLPFIRRMLMEEEEDTDDNILYQQYPDHPALHLAQQPFAQILSAGSTSTATHTHAAANESASGSSATTNSNGAPAFANATWPYDPVELSQLLLCRTRSGTGAGLDGFTGGDANNSFSSPGQGSVSCKNRHNWDDLDDDAETDRRSNKLLAPEPEENSEQVDDVFVKGYEMAIEKMHGLSISDNNGSAPDGKAKRKSAAQANEAVDHWTCAPCSPTARMPCPRATAAARPRGDASQRLAHCFAQALEARLAGTGAQVHRAYKLYLEVCSFKMIAFKFAHIAICKAITGRKKVHIVDYGEHHGFHWPPLLKASKDRDGGPPEVPQRRRVEVGLWEMVCADDLDIEPDEVLIVNGLFHFGKLMDEGVDIDNTSPRDMVLYCYSAMFDIMDATTPRDNEERLLVEQDILGCYVLNAIACEGSERVERPETYKQWQVRGHRILKDGYHKDFVVDVGQQWLLQGWKGRILYAMSTWIADDAISHSCSHPFNKHDTCF
ncbi:unnamed protein product [Miscanthus lutarioriparius]|uniref:Uncharacterized protein n=1 Tax=Miscanthus lutarioriparius TaxID=422564 RepID=A0A811Q148_9POAL|nr:unnamed protein product [Miscanthus lutarioriparius]